MPESTAGYDPNLNYQFYGGVEGGSNSLRKLEAIQLPDLANKSFLDLGCNAGFFCAHALAQGARTVVGVDNSPDIIKVARARHPNIRFLDSGWDAFPEGRYDVVICLSAIHYASSQIALANAVWNHLSEDGLFVLEGGFVDSSRLVYTDLPVVAFREVGDRVRHLSEPFVRQHLFPNFDWRLVGPSVMQGGDPIPRFVIHARKKIAPASHPGEHHFRLDPIEYARAIALCADTVQSAQASSTYVRALGAAVTEKEIGAVLAQPDALTAFADDIAYALARHGSRLTIRETLGEDATRSLAQLLGQRGIEIEIVKAIEAERAAVMTRMEAGVEFTFDGGLEDALELCRLKDARVADLTGGTNLYHLLLEAGVSECHVLGAVGVEDPRLKIHDKGSLAIGVRDLDYVFFDPRHDPAFDYVDDVNPSAAIIGGLLARSGVAFLVLRTGIVQTDWDAPNRISLTPAGKLPSSDFLFNEILADFAVRPISRVRDDAVAGFGVTRIFRIARRQPTLLAIVGPSQSGKTTLARKLRQLPGGLHVSNDYVFYELFRFKSYRRDAAYNARLDELLAGGSAEEVGNFFRAVEDDDILFRDYLRLVLSAIAKNIALVSLDLDLRRADRIEQLKTFFTDAGFIVWVVTK